MLKHLFYYDFHGIRHRALPLLLSAFGCGACSFFIFLLDAVLPSSGDLAVFMNNLLTSVVAALLIAATVLIFLAQIHVFLHYYQTLFTDEGFLTLMLPVTRRQLLLSKIFTGLLWNLIVILSLMIALTVGAIIPVELLIRAENASFLSALFRSIADYFSVLSILDLLVAIGAQTVLIYTAIALAALFFPKKRMLVGLICYTLILGIILLLRALFSLLFETITDWGDICTSLSSVLISLTVGIGGFFTLCTLLERKLNYG